ncbi:unnamed protein product [Candidula unifasciata]|uniref:Uncharacterized protein n=1 Tax=Candidula unifasciata TaxID=100452 RepID=A0A8S3YZ86_9EUPU|nr:unnamed protein product [Candidula unifasciata]
MTSKAMTSKANVYTWIADYACRHRLEDLIFELFKDTGSGRVSITDLSHINLKHALVWMTVKRDCQEGFEEVVRAVDSLLDDAVASDSLELFVRLSLGLRLKDLSHSLSLSKSMFEDKLDRHFPNSKFWLKNNYLFQVFSSKDAHLLEKSIADVCQYFRILIRNKTERSYLLTNYSESQFGNKLSESLKSLTVEFFDRLSFNQPRNMLEKITMSNVGDSMKENSSPWYAWLVDKLSGVRVLNDDVVRELFTSLQQQEVVGLNSQQLIPNDRTVRDRKSLLDMTELRSACSQKAVTFHNRAELSSKCYYCQCESSSSESDDAGLSFVPSSQGELDIWPLHTSIGNYKRNYSGITPNLRQFLKQDGIRGCLVKLKRI